MLRRLQVPSIVMKQTMIKKRTIIPIMIPKVTTSIYNNYFLLLPYLYFNFVFRFSFFFFLSFFFGDSDLLKEGGSLSLSLRWD